MSDTALVIGQASQRAVAFIVAVARRFYSDRCLTHASALAYASLLSIVPLLALMFAVLKGLGVQQRLEPLLLSRLALDPETVTQIMGYIDRVNVGTLGTIGVAALMLTVVNVLGSVETGFNYIWRVRRSRSWLRKATDYLSVLLLTPFLLLGAVAITSSLQVQHVLQWLLGVQYVGDALVQTLRLTPLVMNAVALGVLYAVMPNRQPSMRAIVVGALVAGAAWQVVQVGYVMMQIGVAKYNAIYGALSQLPLLLVWLYISWAVVLAGAELAAVCEFGVGAVSDRRSGVAVGRSSSSVDESRSVLSRWRWCGRATFHSARTAYRRGQRQRNRRIPGAKRVARHRGRRAASLRFGAGSDRDRSRDTEWHAGHGCRTHRM